VEEYCRYYDVTAAAVRRALPGAPSRGPGDDGRGTAFLEQFLDHCVRGASAVGGQRAGLPNFVSFHTKGTPGFERT
jgi:xylan 1,4-beta-xylosidase